MEKPSAVIVEPEHLWRSMLFRHLDHDLGDFLFVPNAVAAHRAIAARQPALVVTELELPDSPGLKFIRQIRSRPLSSTKIVVLSRTFDRQLLEQGLSLGISSYLKKGDAPLVEIALSIASVLALP